MRAIRRLRRCLLLGVLMGAGAGTGLPAAAAPDAKDARDHKAAAAEAAPRHPEALDGGVQLDWAKETVEAPGSCAADLRAPSAEVARVKAERLARDRARERIVKALSQLPRARWEDKPPTAEALAQALAQAEVAAIDRGSNGSVTLRLRLKLSALPVTLLPRAASPAKRAAKAQGGAQ